MSLIQCPECGKEISDKAANCPNCGAPLTIESRSGGKKNRLWIILLVIAILAIIGVLVFFKISSNDSKDLSDIEKSVFKIHCLDANGKEVATGSGFAIYDSKTLVTNYHVLALGHSLYIETSTGANYDISTLYAYSEEEDLAILGVEGETGLNPIEFETEKINKGDKVYTIGSPIGIKNTISDGLISELSYDSEGRLDMIQISAPISPGSSGGVLLDSNYRAIGVTSSGYSSETIQNINYAIPMRKVEELYKEKAQLSLEELVSEIHKNDHKCYLENIDSAESMGIDEVFKYCPGIEGNEVILYGYYSSDGDGFGGYHVMYLYSDKNKITGDIKSDEKLNDTSNQIYYYNKEYEILPVQYEFDSVVFHDDNKFEPGDLVVIYGQIEDREVYGFGYNFEPGEGTVEKIKKKQATKYFDYYSYGVIAKEIECVK